MCIAILSLLIFASKSYAGVPIPFTINLSETVNVTGTPRLQLNIGGVTAYANYTGGTGTSALTFSYPVQAGDFDRDGVTLISPIDLNGGTIKDTNGNNATLTFTPPNTSGVLVQSYTTDWTTDPLDGSNIQASAFSISNAPNGSTYNYTITSSGGAGSVTGSGTISSNPQNVTAIDLTSLPLGTLTLSVTITAPSGTGIAKTDTVTNNVITKLTQIATLSTGNYPVRANSESFTGYVTNISGTRWFLVGRGRNNWDFDADGQGTNADIITNLGTSAAFTPKAYKNAIINSLISNASINLTGVEIRLNRAADTTGTNYQEVFWRPLTQTTWTWDFPTADYNIEYDLRASVLGGAFLDTTGKTRDSLSTPGGNSNNDFTRIFTWAWPEHGSQKGFCYGITTQGTDGNSATSFMWEFTNEVHACPYTEVYIRAE